MVYTLDELRKKTVGQLRDIAANIDSQEVKGYTQMHKDHLLVKLCRALNIDLHEHHSVVGINKSDIKAKIKELKFKRNQALESHNHEQLKDARRKLHRLKRQIHKYTV